MSKRIYVTIPEDVAQALEQYNIKNPSQPINPSGLLTVHLRVLLNIVGGK